MKYNESPPRHVHDELEINDMVNSWIELIGLRHMIECALGHIDEVEDDIDRHYAIDKLRFNNKQVDHEIKEINLSLTFPREY